MISKIFKSKYLFKLLIFIPLIFYFGKRSYIAFDEGFYALQARKVNGLKLLKLCWIYMISDI